jgi:alkanesulfonate monooxygenase SsuD/methylene tetrahydromethanopterin reductase-like flavin-dependent oxidoreductase (luciferase family)
MSALYRLPAQPFQRHLVAGDAPRCARAIARFYDGGAQHVVVFPTSDDPLVQFEDLAGELAGYGVARIESPGALRSGPRGSEMSSC